MEQGRSQVKSTLGKRNSVFGFAHVIITPMAFRPFDSVARVFQHSARVPAPEASQVKGSKPRFFSVRKRVSFLKRKNDGSQSMCGVYL